MKDPAKNWKFNPGDLKERGLWDEYQAAYQDALEKCSTAAAPWYIVPSDRKWFRNYVLGDTIVCALEQLKMKGPKPLAGLSKIVIG